MGNYYISASKTISELVGLTGDEASAIRNLGDPENRLVLAAGGASAAKIGVTMIETLGKKLPGAGTGLTLVTLSCTVFQIGTDVLDPMGVVKTKDILGATSDVAGLASLAALAGATVLGAPVAIGLGIGLALVSAGLGVASLHPSIQEDPLINSKLGKYFNLHRDPRGFDNVKYIDMEAYLALPGSSIELVMQLQKQNLRNKAYPIRPVRPITHALPIRQVMENYRGSRRNSPAHGHTIPQYRSQIEHYML